MSYLREPWIVWTRLKNHIPPDGLPHYCFDQNLLYLNWLHHSEYANGQTSK